MIRATWRNVSSFLRAFFAVFMFRDIAPGLPHTR
jgi:hypothetical protein